jgi:shikimate dehydrogenase
MCRYSRNASQGEHDNDAVSNHMQMLKLGLIGDHIAQSRAPNLHETAGKLTGLDVSYDLLVPADLALDFDAVFERARATGYHGLNITYPYKERVMPKVSVTDPLVAAIGAVNTVVFSAAGPQGYNTDYSGFMLAYRTVRGDAPPGTVCLIGTGGVGKAVAFGLLQLGAKAIRCCDTDTDKAQALATALNALGTSTKIEVSDTTVLAASGADGVINCTPLGMSDIGGSPLPASAMKGAFWAFDAVYTPVNTVFLQDAAAGGLTVISGYELFFGQGIDAWAFFTADRNFKHGDLDQTALRAAIS